MHLRFGYCPSRHVCIEPIYGARNLAIKDQKQASVGRCSNVSMSEVKMSVFWFCDVLDSYPTIHLFNHLQIPSLYHQTLIHSPGLRHSSNCFECSHANFVVHMKRLYPCHPDTHVPIIRDDACTVHLAHLNQCIILMVSTSLQIHLNTQSQFCRTPPIHDLEKHWTACLRNQFPRYILVVAGVPSGC
jgi:hypothetical protein